MTQTDAARHQVDARILYWGIEGSGKSANLQAIHARLRPDHRGELNRVPTALDPTATYEILPIELGEVAGVRTRIQAIAVPGAPEQAPTRKKLLDGVDGLVFVIDARREQLDANLASFEELRRGLAAYGRSLDRIPLVLQYNKRDLADPYALEELHRKLDARGAAAFEAVAPDGIGVIQTLTTISKRVIRSLRDAGEVDPPEPARRDPMRRPEAAPPPASAGRETPRAAHPDPAELAGAPAGGFEAPDSAARTQVLLGPTWGEATDRLPGLALDENPVVGGWRLLRSGPARLEGADRLELPLVLADENGQEVRLRLRVALELDLERESV